MVADGDGRKLLEVDDFEAESKTLEDLLAQQVGVRHRDGDQVHAGIVSRSGLIARRFLR